MPFLNNNIALGLPRDGVFQVGVTNVDSRTIIEQGVLLPWPSDPAASWVYYDCTVSVKLDSGIVVHNRLPQVDHTADSLSSCYLEDPQLDNLPSRGVNIQSKDQYTDIVQRMGHSRYWFNLRGQALRIGKQVPIPALKSIGGVPAIPYDRTPQFAYNRIFPGGNYAGVILWHAAWSLWYTTAVPPRSNAIPAADAAAHISGTTPNPDVRGIQAPYSQPDDNAVRSAPPTRGTKF